ncbi:MAG: hypothetical protein PHE27_06905 [Alphaproteobacteria bacterium]|nr:hypothetical protein [Alphaproteobacteria bacterium]
MQNTIQTAIAANLAALSERLSKAATLAKEAHEAMEQDNQNLAIGTVLDFEKRLPEAQALFAAAMALHRGNM